MENLKHIEYRKPLLLQMLIAGIISMVSITACAWTFGILVSVIERSTLGHDAIEAIISLSAVLLIVYVPLCLSTLLFLHLTGMFKYIIYSKRMIVLESSLFVVSDLVIDWSMKELYFKSVLFSSIIILIFAALIIKKSFQQYCLNFQKKMGNSYVRPYIEAKIDINLTIMITVLLLIPSLFFVYIFFP